MKILTKIQPKISRKTSGPWSFAGWLGSGAGGVPPVADGPDPFVIPAKVDQEPSTSITSAIVTPTGQGNVDAPITVTGGRYQINGVGGFVSTPGVFNAGDYFEAQVDSGSYGDNTSCTIQINDVSAAFTVTARAQDATPDAFSFVDETGAAPNTMITSAPVTIQGMDDNCPVSVVGGEYDVNASDSWTTAPGTVNSGDAVRVRRLSSTGADMTVDVVFTAGTVSDTFSITTIASITLDTGHALGDPVACYILKDSPTTMEGVNILDLANNFNLVLSQTNEGGYVKEPGGGVTFDSTNEGIAKRVGRAVDGYPFTFVFVGKTNAGRDFVNGICQCSSTINNNILQAGIEETVVSNVNVGGTDNYNSGDSNIVSQTIYAVAIVFTSENKRQMFLNGAVDSPIHTEWASFVANSIDAISIGGVAKISTRYNNGTVYSAYIYDRALSDAEAEAITADPYQIINGYSGP